LAVSRATAVRRATLAYRRQPIARAYVRLIVAEESVNSRNSPVTAKAVTSPQPAGPLAPGASADRARLARGGRQSGRHFRRPLCSPAPEVIESVPLSVSAGGPSP